jgi:hypothetical protein
MRTKRPALRCLAAAVIAVAAGCSRNEPLTPEAAKAKGDAMLRQMSQTLSSSQAFSYSTEERREKASAAGAKSEVNFTRQITVRRPNGLTFVQRKAGDVDMAAWYDGKHVTIVSPGTKTWAKGPMPGTLDEAMDFVSAEYAIQLPTADLLYSSPYDALMTPDTTGGWVGVGQVDTRTCEHLSYTQSVVDWEIWLAQDDKRLPYQFQVTYKNEPGKPVARIVFRDWNPAPQVSDATFAANVPDGYARLKIMRHATVEAPATPEAATEPAKTPR